MIICDGTDILLAGKTDLAALRAVEYFMMQYLGYSPSDKSYSVSDCAIPNNLNDRVSFEIPAKIYQIENIRNIYGSCNTEDYNDIVRLCSCLQGQLNKNAKKNGYYVYQMYDSQDEFWLDYLREYGKLLDGSEIVKITNMDELWDAFGSEIQKLGMIVWDPDVPATANAASTVCSVEGYLPVRYDPDDNSLYTWLTQKGVGQEMDSMVGRFLGELGTTIPDTNVPSTGSKKCDAYLWALALYGDRVNSEMIAYTLDGASQVESNPIYHAAQGKTPDWNQLYSHDYLVMNGCFFFDLTCNDEETPCDDPTQPLGTDAATLRKILQFFYDKNNGKMGKLMGFPPWYTKYTTFLGHGAKEATVLEWEFVEVISGYNFIKEADAAHPAWMTNGSVYSQYESNVTYQNTKVEVTEKFDKKTRYFTIYMGDYDSSAWLKEYVPKFFRDSGRGKYPLMWAFNPNLGDRVPMIFDYIFENMTPNDILVTGDSGAGYVIPSMLPDMDAWVAYNEPYTKKYDMDIVGFIINGNNRLTSREFSAYAKIAPVGSFHNDWSQKLTVWNDSTVFMHLMNGINPNDADVARDMYEYASTTGNNFSAYRTVCNSPSEINSAIEAFLKYTASKNDGYTYKYVDPYTLFDLVLQSGQGNKLSGN